MRPNLFIFPLFHFGSLEEFGGASFHGMERFVSTFGGLAYG
jgi:hypothetical protein